MPDIPIMKIGNTIKNVPINYYKIGGGKLKIIFISAMHGNETGTVKLAHKLINFLFENRKKYPEFTFYIIPCLNPDGYGKALKNSDYFNGGRIGRFNDNDVDLNRNFNTPSFKKESVWLSGKNYSNKETVYCGEFGDSEPETKALTDFIKKENIKVLFSFHNAGRDVMGNKVHPSQKLVEIYAKKCKFKIFSEEEWTKLEQSGTLKEWCEENSVAYVEIEGSTRWGSDWKIQKPAVEATLLELKLLKNPSAKPFSSRR